MTEAIETLCKTIVRARKAGRASRTTCRIVERLPSMDYQKSTKTIVDDFVSGIGFTALKDRWRKIDFIEAQVILKIILSRDMDYQSKAMTSERAKNLAEQFLALFEDARFFTNGIFNENGSHEFNSITDATLDAGVICVNSTNIGILWVEDED